jgi:general secretion pathway protein I
MLLNKSEKKFKQQGFSLMEVLIGLAILAIALMAGIKALSQTVQTQTVVQQQYLATLSANNALNKVYLQKLWPEFEVYKENCSQLNVSLVCIRKAFATPNPLFRRVEIEVYLASPTDPTTPQSQPLAKLTTIVFNYLTSNL